MKAKPRRLDVYKRQGPIIIGQAAEFDYAGTQACRALKEEGIEVVLVNSNPATIMTDKDIADRVYICLLYTSYTKIHKLFQSFLSREPPFRIRRGSILPIPVPR